VHELRKPRALRPGATLGIAAPGGPVDPAATDAGCALLERAGFRIHRRDDLTARCGYLAGDDARRSAELEELWSDPRVDGIVCARGGYGCARILPRLDPGWARDAAKPLVGYSDATALLLWQARHAGLAGFHGPMLEYGSELAPASIAALVAWLTGDVELPATLPGRPAFAGQAEGPLVGGSLTLVTSSIGTDWEIDTHGAILLLEEVHENPYRVDRMLQQLRDAGKLDSIVGLGIGDVSTCTDSKYGTCIDDVVLEIARTLRVPCVAGLGFGHTPSNSTWPFGGRASIDGERGEIRMLELGVKAAT